ncbi:hypothetical protein [uncultured Paraglaciecola sp.]|uniref:hypothetical protein n=1 Tax=uncultured Paraglaciecola sp. TaxID=1765024 RepID=UPI0030D8EE5D|tara:strand:- start:203 stop:1051 length:849 start_codon:yes stop_codon:yes gene_type:complete
MKPSLLLPLLLISLLSLPSAASMMKFSFTGHITQVDNNSNQVWDPLDLMGTKITGYFLMDVELASHGREETSFYWWHNIDYGPGALASSINIANKNYSLSGENDYNALHDGWNTNEYLEYYSGLDQFARPVNDLISLSDNEIVGTQTPEGDLYFQQHISIVFSDSFNDFLKDFGPSVGGAEPQPDWRQTFSWENDGSANNGKMGKGGFSYRKTLYPNSGGREDLFSASVGFNLSQVTASPFTAVSEPSSMWIICCLILAYFINYFLSRRRPILHSRVPSAWL